MSLRLGTTLLAGVATNTIANAHDLFDFIWSDHIKNEVSWLRADTFSWQSGAVYELAYNHLVDDIDGKTATSETIGSYTISYYLADDGHKITTDEATVADIYDESGVAWYYVLDTVNTRFKLPRENPSKEELTELTQAPVTGNGLTVAWTNGSATGGTFADGGSGSRYGLMAKETGVGQPVAGSSSSGTYISGRLGVTTDASTSGLISRLDLATKKSEYAGRKYLYFYVGQFSQTATEQTAGLNSELFNGKLDLDLGNATSSTKETIVGWGMPDYSRGVLYTANTTGVLEYDSKVIVQTSIQGNCSARFVVLDENDNIIDDLRCYGTTSANGICTCASSIFQKGIKYQMNFTNGGTGAGTSAIMIYPLKGDV